MRGERGRSVTGELRVNTAELRSGSQGLQESAAGIPEPPAQFTSEGGDDLSLALIQKTQQMEAALIAGLPDTKAKALKTAQDIGTAADTYERTDQQIADQIQKRVAEFDQTYGAPKSAAGGGGAEQALGQFGQLAQMPMQFVQQAGQLPGQVVQQVGQVPQSAMQGVQQVSQMTGGLGSGPGASGQQSQASKGSAPADQGAESGNGNEAQAEVAGAPGSNATERAPVSAPRTAQQPSVDPSILL